MQWAELGSGCGPGWSVPHTNQILTVNTTSFSVPARRGIHSSHPRPGRGISLCWKRKIRGKESSASPVGWFWMCWGTPTWGRKARFDGEFSHKGTTQTEKLFPCFRRNSFQLFFFNQLLGGTSVLVGKHFQFNNFSSFSKRITSIFLSHSINRGEKKIQEIM